MNALSFMCVISLPLTVLAMEAPVVSVTATCDGDSVYAHLNWDPVAGANCYGVYQTRLLGDSPSLVRQVYFPRCDVAVPTDWEWDSQPKVLAFFSVRAQSAPVQSLLPVPGGTFGMSWGSGFPVTLTHSTLFATHEITNEEFANAAQWALSRGLAQVTGGNLTAYGQVLLQLSSSYCEVTYAAGQFGLRRAPGSGSWGFDNTHYNPALHPIQSVTWYGAACFCDWLSAMNGLTPYYQGQWSQIPSTRNPYLATGFRLPTEAEWEYVAQFNPERSRIQYPWGNAAATCDRANYRPSDYCVGWTSPVGTHPEGNNSLGLQDLGGNVWEWCNDWFGSYNETPQSNPVGALNGSSRVVRGSSWNAAEAASAMQNAQRGYYTPSTYSSGIGFRVCRSVN